MDSSSWRGFPADAPGRRFSRAISILSLTHLPAVQPFHRLARAAAARLLAPRGSRREAVWMGARLGGLTREGIHRLDERYYGGDGPRIDYAGEAHNTRGLFAWEAPAVERFFADRRKLLVMAAGGGREVLALRRMGFEADGYECHPGLAAAATELLARHGHPGPVGVVPRDEAPRTEARYDGVIVGWSAYMLIQGRARRIAFLRGVRDLVGPGAPILLSFFYRDGSAHRHAWIGRTANALRRLLGREAVEEGDILDPNFIHLFTEVEIRDELREGGFDCVFYSTEGTGHAVGRAVEKT